MGPSCTSWNSTTATKPNTPSPSAASLPLADPTPMASTILALPPSLANYPLRILYAGAILQASIVGRSVDATGTHSYAVRLPAPYVNIPHAIDTEELHRAIAQARKQSKIAAPARKLPELTPVLRGAPVVDGILWTSRHPLVGTV